VNAVLLGINPFDQFGVELGKEMAKAAEGRRHGFRSFDHRSDRARLSLTRSRQAGTAACSTSAAI
jgi:hypothetical protein